YEGPGFGSHVLAVVVKLTPKVGVLSLLAIKIPTAKTEGLYVSSVNHTIDSFTAILNRLRDDPKAGLALPNLDLDTGNPVRPGTYRLTDETYAQLLARLTLQDGRPIPARLQSNILAFYADPDAPNHTKKNPKAWKRVQDELVILRNMQTTPD
ncbi:MAG TPA: hypothetical protein VMD76_10845, partial [Candidatus Sulfotelmatobacter sp.]|nr:hypothetical protein [Candidatus Sulfotelmatobacter sp.]